MDVETSVEDILDRIRQGDSAAANRVFTGYVERLRALTRSRLADRLTAKFDADDVVQSVFRSFFRRNAAGEFHVKDWHELWGLLARITVRKCGRRVVRYGRGKRDIRRETALRGHSFSEFQWEAFSRDPTPDEAAALEDLLSQLMESLDETQRALVALKLQGHTNEEISRMIGRSERTVYRVLRDVRECLRRFEVSLA